VTPANDERCTVSAESTWQVETMMTADGLQLTAYGPDGDEIHVVEGGIGV
jgi:hypothetical protein